MEEKKTKKIGLFLKRFFDIIAALGGLLVFSPIILISILAIKIKLGSPILFTQERIGKDNKIFKIIKFRTMKNLKDSKGNILPDEKRKTKLGSFLRSTSIDELPELINILKGDMSLIGPRPLLVEYLSLYDEEQIKRHNVKPGMTGWAQINGRNSISWCEKFKLDVWYVENWSFKLDIKIFFKTFYKLFKRHGINQSENVTMEKFNGRN
ncbi:sugar transferase [Clostridium tarantellae]|uniref:Sugar transferase n=1 Tax=Clostridium tarantellae TaxID=39493 RepID=A0A6I1MRN4_9CLOT|nr:sugar transferase [Clostridium tarantellae]MPQ44857.1 sugar transferase [Clostridium tarantellae]